MRTKIALLAGTALLLTGCSAVDYETRDECDALGVVIDEAGITQTDLVTDPVSAKASFVELGDRIDAETTLFSAYADAVRAFGNSIPATFPEGTEGDLALMRAASSDMEAESGRYESTCFA